MSGKKPRAQKTTEQKKDAKERLLEAAIKIFASHGYEATSTRMLIKEADVNISAIPYYFGSKDGLYEAVIRHIVSFAHEKIAIEAMKIRQALCEDNLTQNKAKKLLHDFISGFAMFLISEEISPYIAPIIIREQMQPSSVFNIMYEGLMRPVHETLTQLIAYVTGLDAESEEAILCTYTIFGQILIFKTHREFVLRRTAWEAYSDKEAAAIVKIILQNTDAIIAAHKRTKS